jgi:tetratricopeptide (TPR) repeat protein
MKTVMKAQKNNTQRMLELALIHHRSGQIKQAETLYRNILNTTPGHPDALHLLGLIEFQRGNLMVSERFIRRAIARDGRAPFFYLNLGNTLKGQGRTDEAIDVYKKAITLDPNLAEAHFNLANELFERRSFETAILHYKSAISLNPGIAGAHYNLGKALQETGRDDDAAESYQNAIKRKPDYAEAYFCLGVIFHDRNRLGEAEECYQQAISAKADYAEAFYNLADVLSEQGKYEEAEYSLRRAIFIKSDYAEAYNNLGNVLRDMGRREEALENYRVALDIKPGYADAYNNIAIAHRENGMPGDAMASCQKALDLRPDFAEAHWNMALALLTNGDFRSGWEKYEWRFLKRGAHARHLLYPTWDGSSLAGKTVLIYAEQGIGDEIMFSSCLPEVIERAKYCVVECDRRLVPLFARSFPGVEVIEKNSAISSPAKIGRGGIDFQIPVGSLPKFFRGDISSFPQRRGYLISAAEQRAVWKERMDALGPGLKVGISWRGGKDPAVRHVRSTNLEQWKDLLLVPGTHFINLQYGEFSEEIIQARERLGVLIHDWNDADPLTDLDFFAAQISSLDLVISVDNSTVHMAGALGVPVWTLLPFGCDWRWMRDVTDTPWYSSMKLFRQTRPGEWPEVFRNVAEELAEVSK